MERLIVEVPAESLCIKSASCPNGHLLMDPDHPMDGLSSIRVIATGGGNVCEIHLHPCYGNFEVDSPVPLKEGEVYELSCPVCRVSLASQDEKCVFCGATMFALNLPKGGLVLGCSRKGCHNHKLKVVDLDGQLAELFELDTRPRY